MKNIKLRKSNNYEKNKKDVILINKMCTGTYTVNNIGHEIINYFKASDNNVYIYILPYGSMNKKYDNRIETILLTSSLSNHRIEIIAKIDNPEQQILFGDKKYQKLQLEDKYTKIHNEQIEKYKDIKYGGKTLDSIFKYNYENEKAIYITFSAKPKNIKKPKNGTHIYITDNDKYYDNKNNCKYIKINRNLTSSSLKQYFEKIINIKEEKDKDYNTIINALKNEDDWEDFKPEEITKESIKDKEESKINFLQLIEKEDEEQMYTNMIWYWFSRKDVFNSFLKYFNEEKLLNDSYDLQKEKVIPGGRIDILALGKNNIIIIENKIISNINGVEKDFDNHEEEKDKTQLSKYISGIKKKQEKCEFFNKDKKSNQKDTRKIKGFIFIPDYRKDDFLNELDVYTENKILNDYYTVVQYSELYDFFNQKDIRNIMKKDLYGRKYYDDFINGLEKQKQSNISDKNKIEMKRKFIYAIKHAKNN